MTPITPESLRAAGFSSPGEIKRDWGLTINCITGAVTRPTQVIVTLNENGVIWVHLCRGGASFFLDRNWESIEQLTDLLKVLKGEG